MITALTPFTAAGAAQSKTTPEPVIYVEHARLRDPAYAAKVISKFSWDHGYEQSALLKTVRGLEQQTCARISKLAKDGEEVDGYMADRLRTAPQYDWREKAFAHAWRLPRMASSLYSALGHISVRDVASLNTFSQWLGSNCGMSFLDTVLKDFSRVAEKDTAALKKPQPVAFNPKMELVVQSSRRIFGETEMLTMGTPMQITPVGGQIIRGEWGRKDFNHKLHLYPSLIGFKTPSLSASFARVWTRDNAYNDRVTANTISLLPKPISYGDQLVAATFAVWLGTSEGRTFIANGLAQIDKTTPDTYSGDFYSNMQRRFDAVPEIK